MTSLHEAGLPRLLRIWETSLTRQMAHKSVAAALWALHASPDIFGAYGCAVALCVHAILSSLAGHAAFDEALCAWDKLEPHDVYAGADNPSRQVWRTPPPDLEAAPLLSPLPQPWPRRASPGAASSSSSSRFSGAPRRGARLSGRRHGLSPLAWSTSLSSERASLLPSAFGPSAVSPRSFARSTRPSLYSGRAR